MSENVTKIGSRMFNYFIILSSLIFGRSVHSAEITIAAPPCGGYYGKINEDKILSLFINLRVSVDCDYYFDYYTSVDNVEDCKSKCKWSCRSA